MRFLLIDKIDQLEPGKKIIAGKSLAMGEDYLRDHFPKFPVMPGVLMVEAMAQAAAWLIRVSDEFKHSIVVLKQVKNVKFGQFLQPGQTLVIEATISKEQGDEVVLKSEGTIDGHSRIRAQLVMTRYNLADKNPGRSRFDEKIISQLKDQLAMIWDGY